MRLFAISASRRSDGVRLSGLVEKACPSEKIEVYFDFTNPEMASVGPSADAFAAAMLIPAMRGNETLEIIPPVSPRLHLQLPRIRDLFHTWYPEFARVDIKTTAAAEFADPTAGSATFFSGGVDSFYTLLKYQSGAACLPHPLSHIVFMRGVETKLEYSRGVSDSQGLAQSIATMVGVGVIVGETNVRTVLQGPEEYIDWERHYHGSALAAIGLALSPMFGIVCIPSAFTYNHLVPHGSSPLLDEMYSTERVTILHDGAETERAEKVGNIIKWDQALVLANLRVCHHNAGGVRNCGECVKCVRMVLPLKALGLFDSARLFETSDKKRWVELMSHDHPVFLEENRSFILRNGADAELLSMIDKAFQLRELREHAILKAALKQYAPLTFRALKSTKRIAKDYGHLAEFAGRLFRARSS